MKNRLLTGLAVIVVWFVGILLLPYFQTFYFPRGFWIDEAVCGEIQLRRRPGSERGRCSVLAIGMSRGLKWIGRRATALSWRDSGQSGVAAISVVVNLVTVELPF